MFGKIGGLLSSVFDVVSKYMPFMSEAIKVKIAADDIAGIEVALKEMKQFGEAISGSADIGLAAVADGTLDLAEAEEMARALAAVVVEAKEMGAAAVAAV